MPGPAVVVVDDDANVTAGLQQLLTIWGYNVVAFETFEAARAFLHEQPPDALIVDVRLGSFNGLQLVHIAKRLSPAVRSLVLSGFDDVNLRSEAAQAGATFLLKPVDVGQLRHWLMGDAAPVGS